MALEKNTPQFIRSFIFLTTSQQPWIIRNTIAIFCDLRKAFDTVNIPILLNKFKKMGVSGFVFGILNEDNTINKNQNKELVDLAHPLPCTFHRAFDEVTHSIQALEDIIQCGFTTILTSGQVPNVVEGVDQLARLVEAADKRITIMPGGGLRSSNIEFIQQKTQATFFHSSAIIDEGELPNPNEIVALKSKLQ